MTTLVDRLTAPLPLNELVKTGVHCAMGRSKLVLSRRVNGPPSMPLVALKVSVLPLMLMLVICGGVVTGTVVNCNWTRLEAVLSTRFPVYPAGRTRFKLLYGSPPV